MTGVMLKKELQGLRLPLLASLAFALFTPAALIKSHSYYGPFLVFALGMGVCILPSIAFGQEFQFGTLLLILSQPVSRKKWWAQKHLSVVLAVLFVTVSFFIGWFFARQFEVGGELSSGDWSKFLELAWTILCSLVALICSSGFCALIARSTIGGVVFSVGWLIALWSLASAVVEKIFHGDYWVPIAIIFTAIYSMIMQWLGWKTFARLQVTGIVSQHSFLPVESPPAPWMSSLARLVAILRTPAVTASHPLRNLIWKELNLQLPTIYLGLMGFVISGLLTLSMHCSNNYRVQLAHTVDIALFAQAGLVFILAGTASLGQERELGISTWHLTLPIPSFKQWSLKFFVALSVAAVFGGLLPFLVSRFSADPNIDNYRTFLFGHIDARPMFIGGFTFFVLGFWAVAMWGSIVRGTVGALGTGFTLFTIMGAFMALGESQDALNHPLEAGLFKRIYATQQSSPATMQVLPQILLIGFGSIMAVMILWQSYAAFRKIQPGTRWIWKNIVMLACVTALSGWWGVDLFASSQVAMRELTSELNKVLSRQLGLREHDHSQPITMFGSDLAEQSLLNENLRRWLAGASLEIQPGVAHQYGNTDASTRREVVYEVKFPNGNKMRSSFSIDLTSTPSPAQR